MVYVVWQEYIRRNIAPESASYQEALDKVLFLYMVLWPTHETCFKKLWWIQNDDVSNSFILSAFINWHSRIWKSFYFLLFYFYICLFLLVWTHEFIFNFMGYNPLSSFIHFYSSITLELDSGNYFKLTLNTTYAPLTWYNNPLNISLFLSQIFFRQILYSQPQN